ncbi:unnamed protein product [Knipowitschia caucasica]|uniref:TATA box-binding protein-associated factor RNA polymerase I subunit B n=1 Tax=Knipowitschia caucasica TaxID=637954 RepID=A0AAV2KA34_KNICA
MDEHLTGGFSEPCGTCSEVSWGLTDDGAFYCRNCHNVIERTQEVHDLGDPGMTRISSVRKGSRGKKAEGGRQWMVCEGFQFILKSQAEALLKLGVDPKFKDQVLGRIWRLFLNRTHQAYTHTPARSGSFRLVRDTADSETGPSSASGLDSGSGLDSDPGLRSSAGSVTGELSDWSLGSVDSDAFVSSAMKRRRMKTQMSMKRTLSLLHLALVWARSEVTLSLLLRLVHQGVVPYINSYESFPDEMKLNNKDGLIFRETSVPSYSSVHTDAVELIRLLPLPAFPPIGIKSPQHPLNLSLRYMIQLNLPDEMAEWVEFVLDQTDLMSSSGLDKFSGLDRSSGLPQYELVAAAAVMVTMKLLFGLDDQTEWELSSGAPSSGSVFSLRRWYRFLQRSLRRGERRSRRSRARKQWVPFKPFFFSHKQKIVVQKKRRVSDCLTSCFRALSSGRHGDADSFSSHPGGGVYSCHFLWGRSPGADGPSMHHMTLRGGARTNLTNPLSEENYWLLRVTSRRPSGPIPHMFLWLLRLFSFLLDVKSKLLLNVVQRLEGVLMRRLRPKRLKRRHRDRDQ